MDLQNKKVLVCGYGKTGKSVVDFIFKIEKTVSVTVFVEKEVENEHGGDSDRLEFFVASTPNDIIANYDLIIVSPGISTSERFFEIAEEQGVEIISEIELANAYFKGTLVGVTGTNGKTTTTTLVNEILKQHSKSKTVGNIGIPFVDEVLELGEEDFAVAELSSYQLETTYSIKPKVSTILNITNDHLLRHKTLDNYIDAKKRIFMNQDLSDYLVLNYDNKYLMEFADELDTNLILFSRVEDLSDKKGVFVKNGEIFSSISGEVEKVMKVSEIKLLGEHNVENVLAAIGITQALGVSIFDIRKSIIAFKGVPHRIEYVRTINGVSFYNDSKATNVESAINAIKSIKAPIVLIVGGDDKNLPLYDLVKYASEYARKVVIIGQSTQNFVNGFNKIGYSDYLIEKTVESAIAKAYEVSNVGDCILLSPGCASYDMFNNFEERGNLFRETVLAIRG